MTCCGCEKDMGNDTAVLCPQCKEAFCVNCFMGCEIGKGCWAHLNSGISKQLILPVGLPRSGKSTIMRRLSRVHGAPLVCPDEVRLVIHGTEFRRGAESFVWGTVKSIVPALFNAGHRIVIVDACNINRFARDSWKSDSWKRVFFDLTHVGKELCLRRAREGSASEGLIEAIERMALELVPIEEDERDG